MGIRTPRLLKAVYLTALLMSLNVSMAQAVTPDCGAKLTKNTKLDADMNCPETALHLSGNASKKVTLDCKGHSISTTDGSAIFVSNVTGVTIKNCVIVTDNYFSHGIVLTDGTTKSLLSKNTITTNGANSRGIELRDASANKIIANTIDTETEFSDGIRLRAGSNKNLISKNIFLTGNSYSVVLQSSSKNKIYDNTLYSPKGFMQQKKFALQNGGLGVDSNGNIYAVENNWGSSAGIGVATAFFQVDPLTGLGHSIIPLLVGVDDIGFGFDALDILPNGRILALAGSGLASNLYEIDRNTGQVTSIVLNLPVLSGKANGLESIDNMNLLATTNAGELLNINLTTKNVTIVGAQGIGWTDVAAHPTNGKTYAVSRRRDEVTNTAHLYEINADSGLVVTEIGDTGRASISSIDFALDETLYANSDGLLVEIDINDASTSTNGPAGLGPDLLEPFASKTKLKNNLMQNDHGSVRFPGTITLPTETATILSAAVIDIGANQVMIDSTTQPYLDEPGRITLENLTEDYLNLLVDPEDDESFVPCESPQCKFISYLDGTLVFDVTGFTTYSSEENTDPTFEFVIAVVKAEIKALQSGAGVSKSAKKKLKAAEKDITKALKFLKKGNIKNALSEISKAVANLLKAQNKGAPVSDLIDQQVEGSKAEAQAAIDAAIDVGGNQEFIDAAQANMLEAQNQLDLNKPDKAINFFKTAWVNGQKAISDGGGDTTPDAFSFINQTNVALNAVITSNSITVAGIDAAANISITDGEYSIDNGTFSSVPGTITNGQTVLVRHTASSLPNTPVSTLLDIGGVSETFTSTTGAIVTGFNQVRGFNETVLSISAATDGSGDVYAGGDFTTYNGTGSNYIIRINSDGTVDTAFAVGTGFGPSGTSMVLNISPAIDGSGDVYVGGNFLLYNGAVSKRIIRLNSDGSVDSAFEIGTGFNSTVLSISPANDGSGDVYVGGRFTSYNGTSSNRIIRLNSDGSVDTAFSIGTGFGPSSSSIVESISPATDGSGDVYVGGRFTTYNGTSSNRIIRLNSNGTVDAAFAVGSGFSRGGVDSIRSVTDGSGDVYVGGTFTSYNSTSSNLMIRLNSNGTVDTTFEFDNGFVGSINLATDGSGDVYVGGGGNFIDYNGNNLIRLNSDDTVDTTFAIGSGLNSNVTSILPATDGTGDVYVSGSFTSFNGTGSNRIIRLNSDGTVDAAFAIGSGFNLMVRNISPATDGSGDVYAGGDFTTYNGAASNYIIRLNSNGTVDSAFAVGNGFEGTGISSTVESISPVADGSGDVYVGGNFNGYNGTDSKRIIRLNSNGTVDTAFAIGTGFSHTVLSISPATDGSGDVYVGGRFISYNGTSSKRIIRLNSDGTVDTAFVIGSGFDNSVFSIITATDGSGDVYVGGSFTSYNGANSNRIIRLNNDGTVDTAFAIGTGFNGTVLSISPATDDTGDLYLGGGFTSYNGTSSNRIIRLNNDGSVDTDYTTGAGFSFNPSTFIPRTVGILSPATDGSGDVYVGGNFNGYNGISSNRIIRLNGDGTVDTAFAVGNGFNGLFPLGAFGTHPYGSVESISPATDGSGDVYVGGDFIIYQTTTVDGIARLNADGSSD